jgi:perosamine synthetase
VKECLDTNWVSSAGSFVTKFEAALAGYVGAKYAVATTSGTTALHLALLVAGVGPGDEVLVSTLTFLAPANAIRYTGAWPVFIDADPAYWQMDPSVLAAFLEKGCQWRGGAVYNKDTERPVKAILPVHILGHPCDSNPILELAKRYNLKVIEDATESLGARYQGRMVGNLGDIACFSFNGNKLMTTGSGGMLVTNDAAWAQRAGYLADQAKDDPVEYVHQEVGYNYRLSNVQAALGCAQLERIEGHLEAKRRIATRYRAGLADVEGLTLLAAASWASSANWLYTVLVDETIYPMDSRALMRALGERGIQTRPLWQPGHLSPAHAGCQSCQNGVAEALYQQGLSLPCSVGLDTESQDRVVDALKSLAVTGRVR